MINTTSNNTQKLVETHLKIIRERNKNAVLFMKSQKPFAIFLIVASVAFIFIYATSLNINYFKVSSYYLSHCCRTSDIFLLHSPN